jgi:hypothetical protein
MDAFGVLFGLIFIGALVVSFIQGRAEAGMKSKRLARDDGQSEAAMGSLFGVESWSPGTGINKRFDD